MYPERVWLCPVHPKLGPDAPLEAACNGEMTGKDFRRGMATPKEVNMRRILVLLSLLVSVVGFTATPSGAQVPPHDHFLTVPGSGATVQVGPPRCTLGQTVHGAFLNFHGNVHTGTPATTGGLVITRVLCP